MNPRIPQPVWGALQALRLDQPSSLSLPAGEDGWRQALAFLDRSQLTLPLRARLVETPQWSLVPPAIRARLDSNLADNILRLERTQTALAEIAGRFAVAGVDFLVLKGLSHSPAFVADPRLRVQYDIDLYCPGESVYRARDVLLEMGYEARAGQDEFPVDHLPAMSRRSGWRWRGNFFDPDLPLSVDLHFRFWDPETERLAAPGVEQFWARRVGNVLHPADQLGYAALHAVRHLFRGSLRLGSIHEIAHFLQRRRDDAEFWTEWRRLHAPELRKLESIAFRLAAAYFGAPAAGAEPLPDGAEAWFRRYAWSPVESFYRPNKHELLLHLSLLGSSGDRWQVARRRLLPLRVPGIAEAVHSREDWLGYARFLASRLVHHGRLLLPTLWQLARWPTL